MYRYWYNVDKARHLAVKITLLEARCVVNRVWSVES